MSDQLLVALATTVLLSLVVYLVRDRFVFTKPFHEPVPQPARSEAERLAHLLVTELRLYNLQEVEAVARGQAEPSAELCGDISASQAMYRDHVPATEQGDHFETAVLLILASGDPAISAKLLNPGAQGDA